MVCDCQKQPRPKAPAVSRIRVHSTVLLHGVDKVILFAAVHNGIGHGAGHDRIVGEEAIFPEKREFFVLILCHS
jgi:hypothetical protein